MGKASAKPQEPWDRGDVVFAMFSLTIPVTSFLLVPAIQGTTPGYVLAFCLAPLAFAFLCLKKPRQGVQFAKAAGLLIGLPVAIYLFSEMAMASHEGLPFSRLVLIDKEDRADVFRTSSITQFIYYLACVCTFLFFRFFSNERRLRLLTWGGYLCGIYAVYEVAFYCLTGTSGDFVVNRTYGGEHTASWTQGVNFAGLTLMRAKSFFGEPSFFSIAVLAYLALALRVRDRRLAGLMVVCGLLTFSTSAYIGLLIFLGVEMIVKQRARLTLAFCLVAGLLIVGAGWLLDPELFENIFVSKFTAQNASGHVRQETLEEAIQFFWAAPLSVKLVGLGFGTVYHNVLIAVTLNLGLVGTAFCEIGFASVVLRSLKRRENIDIAAGAIAINVLFWFGVSESYLQIFWVLVAIPFVDNETRKPGPVIRVLKPLRRNLSERPALTV